MPKWEKWNARTFNTLAFEVITTHYAGAPLVRPHLHFLAVVRDALQPPEEPVVDLGHVVDLVNRHRSLRKNLHDI